MFSQTNLTTRRQFLERSAWGFGSAFLLPSLMMQSCTDHNIPPIDPPVVGDPDIDWNELIKEAVITGLGKIPEVGALVSLIAKIVWPNSGDTPWDKVKNQVQIVVNQSIADNNYSQATGRLQGLSTAVSNYKTQVDLKVDVKKFWIDAYNDFGIFQRDFQQPGYEILLLPLFTQYANMYLALLRDAMKFGTSWGMTDGEIQAYYTVLGNKITEFLQYTTTWYTNGRNIQLTTTRDDHTVEPFRSINAYDRFMTMMVLDYSDTWIFYDTTQFPDGAPVNYRLFDSEIYSDPFGNTYKYFGDHPTVALPSQANAFPTQLTVWGSKDIGAVQLTYPAGYGPNGATTTPRMGDTQSGNPNTYDLSPSQPILGVSVSYDYAAERNFTMVINTLQFTFSDGSLSARLGQKPGQFQQYVAYDNYALSSIYIQGVNEQLGQYANCIVFGFRRFPH
ncbi:insecticidal delta-endotoxin Cry8Ea1 family protein [Spirosoma jeollabukense]